MKQDDGAVAVMVAILVVVLVGIAAFVTDFGMAYVNKTALQKAADAASLAAAGKAIDNLQAGETCSQFSARVAANTGGIRTTLETAADSIATKNNSKSTRVGSLGVACSSDNKRIEITYSNTGSTATFLGGIFGESTVSASRTATSDIFVATSATGLRPYAVCAGDIASMQLAAGTAIPWAKATFPNPGCGSYNGNWYTINCPGDTTSSNAKTAEYTEFGCPTEIGIIDQTSVAARNADIVDECTFAAPKPSTPRVPTDCLVSNPGNIGGVAAGKWAALIDQTILLPVFEPTWNDYATANVPSNKCKSGGSNGCYPVRALVAVHVCGYNWGGNDRGVSTQTASGQICAGLNSQIVRDGVSGSGNALWLSLVNLQVSGTSGPGSGSVGTSNLLQTRLIN